MNTMTETPETEKENTVEGGLIAVSDMYRLAALDLFQIPPARHEHTARYLAFFTRRDAEKLLADYDTGNMKASLRDYAAALKRVKDRIFESERLRRHGKGHKRETNPATETG